MKRWLLRISVVLCLLACMTMGSWWVWRIWYAADQLQAAITADDVGQVRFLIRFGAPVETDVIFHYPEASAVEIHGKLLHWTAIDDHSDIAELLLVHGADPNSKSIWGSPLDLWPELAEIVKEVEEEKAGNRAP